MRLNLSLVSFVLLMNVSGLMAQTAIHDATITGPATDPHSSAVLDVKSTDKGVLVPNVDIANLATAAPVTGPAEGLLVYNTNITTGVGYYYWNGAAWVRLMSGNTTPLTGTGATNKVAFWTSTTDLFQDDLFHWDNTNKRLGIGTTAPGLRLDVQTAGYGLPSTTGSNQTFGGFRVSPPTSSGNVVLDMGTSGGTTGAWLQTTLRTDLSSTFPLLLNPNGGNVGIGTTTAPSQRLDVNGVINAAAGYRHANTNQAAGSYLRSNGTNFVPSAIQLSDLPSAGQITVGTSGVGLGVTGSPVALGGTVTITSNATAANTASTIVARDASGNFSAGQVNANLNGQWLRIDDRVIEPNSIASGHARFGYTSYNNNNTAPYADFIHLRSYTDATGGNDNLITLSKSGIAMRVWQQAWNSATPYATYKTVAFVEDIGNFSGLANPSATIGLTAVNGSANTAMRSDGAPALSQAIVPTWTGTHTFSNAAAIRMSNGTAALPALSFTGDPNTGMYWHSADAIGFSTAGVEKMSIASNGDIELNNKIAIQSNDAWLRLNPTNAFTSGVYLANHIRVDGGISSGSIATPGAGAVTATAHVNSQVGFRISNGAATGTYLRGNGTNYVSSAIQAADLPSGSSNYIQNQTAVAQAGAGFWTVGTGRADAFGVSNTSSATGKGFSLYGGPTAGMPTYGIMFAGVATFGSHAGVNFDWATYLTMNASSSRGWIFKAGTGTAGNVASISGNGNMSINGRLRLANNANTELYSNGTRIYARAEAVDGVAEFASYGMYMPRTGQTYNLYLGGKLKVGHNEAGWIDINDANTRISKGAGNAVRMQTNSGYIDIGPQSTSWGHIQTDRARFYFNKGITVDEGLIGSYDENLSLQTSGTTRMTILTSNGNVGIGTAAPTYNLHVNGRIRSNAINETSDARLKKNVTSLNNPLEKVLAMRGVNYFWRTDEFPDMKLDSTLQFGLIAQELEKVVPELVSTDSEGWKSIEYSHIVPILIEAIKELKQENHELHSELDRLVVKMDVMNSTLTELLTNSVKGLTTMETNSQSQQR